MGTVCDFNSVEAWVEFQDELEETSLPEREVEVIESCVNQCWRRDQGLDFVGKAYEETREDQEEHGTPFAPACPQCFGKLPQSGSYHFSQDCENDESWKLA